MTTSSAGNIFMVVAPSGAGKSSLVNALLAADPGIALSISCTTRVPRPGERDKQHYRFVTVEEFQAMRERGDMLEWAEVHDHYYGTPRDRVEDAVRSGTDIVLEIDWQGARQVRGHYPQATGIFILPPSIEALELRLKKRGQDAPQVIARRLLAAGGEMAHASDCEYVIINQDFNLALEQIRHIVAATRLRYANQAVRHADLFSQLGIRKPVATPL
ncbi:guanylate kinase [Castellaniella sp.]|uniref:guanylate kinase n=1 Tax=Castellaniella sp. TaxID=1955812 RepID=UPI003569097E